MDKLEQLGWEKRETENSIEYEKTTSFRGFCGIEYFSTYITINKNTKAIEMYDECEDVIGLTKQELLALAEIVKEM